MTRTLGERYELARPLASGGMGEVWAGYDRRLDRPVAVKLLRATRFPTGTDLPVLARRFERESRLTARLEHPGVPAVFDAGTDEGDLYLVMQLVAGSDLADVIAERGALPVSWAVAAAAQVATVLAVAHDASLVHRDLKPRNIMLSAEGAVTVLDFGVAAVLEPSVSRLTTTGETLGSPAYMAPEQALEGTAGPRADLYALGCVLYEMLLGEPVFADERPLAVMHRHLEDAPTPVRTLRPEVPAELDQLVLDMLAKDPAHRPRDAREVHARLVALLGDLGDLGDGASRPWDPTMPFRRPLAPPTRQASGPALAAPSEPDAIARAGVLVDEGRYSQAAEVLEHALATMFSSRDARRYRLELAVVRHLGGDHRRALADYRSLLSEIDDREEGELRSRLRSQAAFCLVELGEAREALAELRVVLNEEQSRLGTAHCTVFELRHQIAMTRASAGETDAAIGELEELLDDERAALGQDDRSVVELHRQVSRMRARRDPRADRPKG